jgi:hypothetical protein
MSDASSGDAGPEHNAKHEVTQWLEDHGATVWWEETNPWGHEVFTLRRGGDTGGIPDLVVEFDDTVVVIEFKTGSRVGELYDATLQLHGYWTEHIAHDQQFIVGSRVVEVDGFVTASQHSPKGRLFPRYAEVLQPYSDMDESRKWCADAGMLPDAEYRMTEQHTRTLWRLANKSKSNFTTAGGTPHIGSLLSSKIDGNGRQPALLWNAGSQNQDWEVFG